MEDLIKQLNVIFIDVLDNDAISLTADTTAADIAEWDSLSHIQLVVAIEKHFKIRFTASEIQSWKNIADMVRSIDSKLKSR
ncbi:MAG: acyl carrier protein [Bacteroidota bacterium]